MREIILKDRVIVHASTSRFRWISQVVTSYQVECYACSFVIEDREVREDLVPDDSQAAACRMEVVGVPCQGPFAVMDVRAVPSWEVVSREGVDLEEASWVGKTAAPGARRLARSMTCHLPQSSHRKEIGRNRDNGNIQHGT
jgi:hypothetical protein